MESDEKHFINIEDIHKIIQKEYRNKGGVVYSSSGSTGIESSILYTREVTNGAKRRLMELMRLTPLKSEYKVAILWGFGMFPPAHYYMEALSEFGNKVYPLGSGKNMSTDKVIYRIHDVLPEVIVCMPSYLLQICQLLEKEHLLNDVKCYIQFVVTGGEVLTNSMRQKIQLYLGVNIYDSYGMLQIPMIAGECDEKRMHISTEYVAEVLGEDGIITKAGKGILLLSSNKVWPPLMLNRIKTNDIVVLSDEICNCGCTTPTVKVLGRSNLKRKTRGQLIDWNFIISSLNRKGFEGQYYIMIENENVVFHVPDSMKIDELRNELNRLLAIKFLITVDQNFSIPVTRTGKIKYLND